MNGYLNAMRRYFEFSGRSSRSEFWFFVLFVILIGIVASLIDAQLFSPGEFGTGVLSSIVSLVHLIPGVAVSVRRLHDIDRTGWWVLLGIVPSLLLLLTMGGSFFMMGDLIGSDADAGAAGLAGLGIGLAVFGILELIVAIVLLVFYCTRSTPGTNRFGPEPAH